MMTIKEKKISNNLPMTIYDYHYYYGRERKIGEKKEKKSNQHVQFVVIIHLFWIF